MNAETGTETEPADVDTWIHIEVAWSPAPRALSIDTLRLRLGATVADALAATDRPSLAVAGQGDAAFAAAGLSTAVRGHAQALTHALRDGDRVEVLRALQADPMQARRARFEASGGVDALRKRGAAGRRR